MLLPPDRSHVATEARNAASAALDVMSTLEVVQLLARDQHDAVAAVEACAVELAAFVEVAAAQLAQEQAADAPVAVVAGGNLLPALRPENGGCQQVGEVILDPRIIPELRERQVRCIAQTDLKGRRLPGRRRGRRLRLGLWLRGRLGGNGTGPWRRRCTDLTPF